MPTQYTNRRCTAPAALSNDARLPSASVTQVGGAEAERGRDRRKREAPPSTASWMMAWGLPPPPGRSGSARRRRAASVGAVPGVVAAYEEGAGGDAHPRQRRRVRLQLLHQDRARKAEVEEGGGSGRPCRLPPRKKSSSLGMAVGCAPSALAPAGPTGRSCCPSGRSAREWAAARGRHSASHERGTARSTPVVANSEAIDAEDVGEMDASVGTRTRWWQDGRSMICGAGATFPAVRL